MIKQKMTLKCYLESLDKQNPKSQMISRIASGCGVCEVTVYRWISGKVLPDKLKCVKISEITGIPVGQLFDIAVKNA